MQELLLALALGAGALSNFPKESGGRITAAAAGVTLDGGPAVLVAAGDLLTGWRADGSIPPGLPFLLGEGEQAVGAPAAADMDGDRRLEVAVVTASGKVALWSGGPVPGWPVSLGARARAGAAFADVDGDGKLEVVVGDEAGRLHALQRGGGEARGFPVKLGAAVTSTPSSAVFAGGLSLAVGCDDGRVHVVSGAGAPRPGFPLVTAFTVSGAPAFADLDEDGLHDLVVGSQDFKVHVVDQRGRPLPGFPVAAGYRIYEGAAVADLDRDGHLDLVFASADGMLHAVSRTGKPLAGFPVRVGGRTSGGAAVGDLTRSGQLAVAVALADGSVAAVGPGGKPLAGFPVQLRGSEVAASPLLFDIGGDGSLSIFVGTVAGRVHAPRADRAPAPAAAAPGALSPAGSSSAPVAPAAAPWPGPGHDAARTGRYGPNPPTYRALEVQPAQPRTGDRLAAAWKATWLDAAPGEAPPAPRLEWQRDGKPVAGLEGQQILPAGTARRGERWRFTATPPAGGPSAASGEVRILDTAPSAPEVRLDPPAAVRGTPVRAVVARGSTDVDGDAVRYLTEWRLDGLPTGVQGDTFPGERLRRGAQLGARVVATDGELGSPPGLADLRVGNRPPGSPTVALQPAAPRRTEAVKASLGAKVDEPDGDAVVLHHRWSVDGKPVPLPLGAAELPPGLARKHQRARVEVRAFDGTDEGPPAAAEVVLANSAPEAPRVELQPAAPRRGDPLRAVVVAPSQDADGDRVAYAFTWTKNGAPFQPGGDGRGVAGGDVARGDRFEVVVVPSDGEQDGPAGRAAVTVGNTAPTPPAMALEPRHPLGGQPLRVVVAEPARDADGDAVALRFAWARGGAALAAAGDALPGAEARKHTRIRVVVTPSDGQVDGRAAVDEVLVENAPPGAPAVALKPERPVKGQALSAVLSAPAPDADGDALTYRYRWLRDGQPVEVGGAPGGGKASGGWSEVAAVPAALVAKGQRWEVEVQASDGEASGPVARAAVAVVNSPPPRPSVAFRDAAPRRGDGLAALVQQAEDADGDRLTHRFAWFRDGQPVEAGPEQAQLPRGTARKGQRWKVTVTASDGEAESEPASAEVLVVNTPPGPAGLALCDGLVAGGTTPEVRVAAPAADPDGDALTYRTQWTLDGEPISGAGGTSLGRPLKKHQRARATVTPWDGEAAGPSSAAGCEARDTPPTAPEVALEPASQTAGSGLTARLARPAADHDGDPIVYRHRWTRDGLPVALDGAQVAAGTPRHGEVWRVEVAAFDGELEGPPAAARARIGNTPPPPPAVSLAPERPAVGQPITCRAAAPERDADGEAVQARIRWYRDGALQPLGEGQPVLPAGLTRRDERWRCEAWTSDGAAESGRVQAEVLVANSPPGAPGVAIDPAGATRADALTCRVATPSADPDGDDVTYAPAWTRNGRALTGLADPAVVPVGVAVKGDRLRCTVTPSDGQLAGAPGSAEVVVANAAPGPALVRLRPAVPRAGEPLACEVVTPAVDPDQDVVRYRFRWERNGEPQPFFEASGEVPGRLVAAGQRWRCAVVPTDGALDGPGSATDEVDVGKPQ